MVFKEVLNSFIGKKSAKEDTSQEVEKLKQEIARLCKEKEARNDMILKEKEIECKMTIQKNQALQHEINQLKMTLETHKRAGDKSSEMLKQNLDKISALENEMQEIKNLKDETETEMEEIKTDYANQKKNIDQMNGLIRLMADIGGKNANKDGASTSSTLSEVDIVSMLPSLYEKCNEDVGKKKSKKKKKSKSCGENLQKSSPQEKSSPTLQPTAPPISNPPISHPPISHPPMSQNSFSPMMPQTSNSFMGAPQSMGEPWMVRPFNQGVPPLFLGPQLPQTPPHNFNHPPPSMYMLPPKVMPPPLMQSSSPSNNLQGSQYQGKPIIRPNILNQPNNLNKNDNKEKKTNTTKVDKCDQEKDLWSLLEELKIKIQKKQSNKFQLNNDVSAMMNDVSHSTIPSKDHFIKALSTCLADIAKMPEKNEPEAGSCKNSGYQRTNFRGQVCKNYNQNRRGSYSWNRNSSGERGQGSNFQGQRSYSRPHDSSSGERGRSSDFQGQRSHSRPLDRKSDDENCSDNDDISSLCSEPPYYRNPKGEYRPQGRGNWRGQRGGRGNFRGRYPRHVNPSNKSNTVEIAAEASENQTTTQLNRPTKTNMAKEPTNDLISFDAPRKSYSKGAAYANEQIMKQFVGYNIPTLTEALLKEIDVNLKVNGYIMVSTEEGNVIKQKPSTLLDIIQFKRDHPDGCIIKESSAGK